MAAGEGGQATVKIFYNAAAQAHGPHFPYKNIHHIQLTFIRRPDRFYEGAVSGGVPSNPHGASPENQLGCKKNDTCYTAMSNEMDFISFLRKFGGWRRTIG